MPAHTLPHTDPPDPKADTTHPAHPEPDHRYNDPHISPLDFLKAVYTDTSVPMFLRLRAAQAAMPYEAVTPFVYEPGEYRATIIIHAIPGHEQDVSVIQPGIRH